MMNKPMKIVIPGGTGQVGTILARAFSSDGHDVVVLSRNATAAPWRVVAWDAQTLGPWTKEIEGADVIINLAGRSVNCRYNDANRRAIMDSRVISTRVIGEAISNASTPPRVWLQASTATIYAHRYDAPNDDETGILGGSEPNVPETWNFSIDVAKSWERATDESVTPNTRKVKMRTAVTMSPDPGGPFDLLLKLVRLGLGGLAASGQQYISWLHYVDFVRAVYWLIEHEELEGPVNLSAPNPLPNVEFMRILRKALGVPIGLSATGWMLGIAAFLMRTETELILKSRRVTPSLLLRSGFTFQFPSWPEAAEDLCMKWKEIER
jgi:uncharacterized protein (TIGR01777 family)